MPSGRPPLNFMLTPAKVGGKEAEEGSRRKLEVGGQMLVHCISEDEIVWPVLFVPALAQTGRRLDWNSLLGASLLSRFCWELRIEPATDAR
jgi:hypothetical protein